LTLGGVALGGRDNPVPGKATVELKFDKKQYYFGEPCQVEFILRNTDDKEISYSFGGDYRGANRALRFRVQALDADGKPVPDADPTDCMGGLGGVNSLKPREEWRQKLWPLDYLRLTKPGKYTIRITHDLGWCREERTWGFIAKDDKSPFVSDDWKAPIGEAQVEFLAINAQQAEKILDAISEELKKPRGDESRLVPSPQDLALPVYLPLLKKRALAGEQFFLQALGAIPTKEATLALLELAEKKSFPDANAAAYLLSWRMPYPPHIPLNHWNEERKRMVEAAWDESYVPRARAIAQALVVTFDPNSPAPKPQNMSASGYFRNMIASEFKDVDLGATILSCVGTAEDYEILRVALDKAFVLTLTPRRGTDVNILNFPAPMPELIHALDALHKQGLKLPESCSGAAEIYLSFHWLANKPPPRPERWLENAKAFNAPNNYPTQMAILESIPSPMPPECRELVRDLLNAQDYGTLMKACEVAGASGDKSFLPAVLAIIRTEHNDWLFRAAVGAAAVLGARRELAEALVERFPDEKLCGEVMQGLVHLAVDLQSKGGGSSGTVTREDRIAAQAAWRVFIAAHGEAIEAGKKFQAGDDKNLPRVLFLRSYWMLSDGTRWPAEEVSPKEKTARLLRALCETLAASEPEPNAVQAAAQVWMEALQRQEKDYFHRSEILPALRQMVFLGLTDEVIKAIAILKDRYPDSDTSWQRKDDFANLDVLGREAALSQGHCKTPMIMVYPAGREQDETVLLWEIQGEPESRFSDGFGNWQIEVPELRQMPFPKLDGRWDLEITAFVKDQGTQRIAWLPKAASTGQCRVKLPPGLVSLRGVLHESGEPSHTWPGMWVFATHAKNIFTASVSDGVRSKPWPPRPELIQGFWNDYSREEHRTFTLGEKIRIEPGKSYLLSAWIQDNPRHVNNTIQFGVFLLDKDGNRIRTEDGKHDAPMLDCGIHRMRPGIWTYAAMALVGGANPNKDTAYASPRKFYTKDAVYVQPVLETHASTSIADLFFGEAR